MMNQCSNSNPPPCLHYHLLLPSLLALIMVVTTAAMHGDRSIYLLQVEGEPVAFHQTITSQSKTNKFESQREFSKEHAKYLEDSHDLLLRSNLEASTYNKLYSYVHIFNGFAVHTTPSQARRLAAAPGVIHIERDRGARLMTTYTPRLLGLQGGVWNQEGGPRHAGEGIVIGVIDTGINPTHPSFAYEPSDPYSKYENQIDDQSCGACDVGPNFPLGSCNGKIVSAKYFSAGAAAVIPLNASEDLSPFDTTGHGSHVASIAAGNWGIPVVVRGFEYGTASGMAPRARLGIYKAIYPQGGTVADVLSAIDQAAQDKVDVLVLSVGPDEPPEGTLTFMSIFDIFLLFARRAGIFVAQAAGNKGPGEATVISFSPWAMGVAASTTGRTYTPSLLTGHGLQLHGVGLSAPTFGDGLLQYKLVSAKDAAVPAAGQLAEECQHAAALQPAAVQGSIVICNFTEGFLNGSSTVVTILNTADVLGFAGFVLVANPAYGDFIAEPLPFSIPGIMIPGVNDTQILLDYYERNTYKDARGVVIRYGASAAIKEGRLAEFNEPTPIVARSSSRGPDILDNNLTATDVLKPDILAPGHQIWAAWSPSSIDDPILSGDCFALLSGTSMSTPHVAGIAALIKQSHPSWSPAMIASALSTTTTKHNSNGLPIMSQGAELYSLYPATPFDYGAGFVDPSAALHPGLVFPAEFEDYVSFLCSLPNLDPEAVKSATGTECNAPLAYPTDLNLPSITVSALSRSRLVRRHVINVGSKQETYLCSTLPPYGVQVSVQPSWFTLLPQERQDLEIKLEATSALDYFSFGELVLTGSLNHIVRIPISVWPIRSQ